jgi:hypothetical protein
MRLVALSQTGQEVSDVLSGDLPDLGSPARTQGCGVAFQVPPVRLKRVLGQAALDGQVVEIPRDRARECRQPSTSARVRDGSPCASATGSQVRFPS